MFLLLLLPQKAEPAQSATQQPALATKWGAPTTQRGLWSLVPSQLLWAWLLHQTAGLNCLWSTLPILPRANISSLQESSQDPVCQSETSQFFSFPDPFGGISGYPPAEHCLVSEAAQGNASKGNIMPPEVETMTKMSHHNLNHCSVSAEVEIQSP